MGRLQVDVTTTDGIFCYAVDCVYTIYTTQNYTIRVEDVLV
jgi:hypothetical protein